VEYDPRYLEGIARFNRAEYFEAHEIWEDVWNDCPAGDRRFHQALIQAAVALHHAYNRNRAGAERLLDSGRRYMAAYRPIHNGLTVDAFWDGVAGAISSALAGSPGPPPKIVLESPIVPGPLP
jgi:hypothetical protein